jgi:RHS repeat-associated protein
VVDLVNRLETEARNARQGRLADHLTRIDWRPLKYQQLSRPPTPRPCAPSRVPRSSNTGGADSARKYIGQFADQSNLDYLNARYYDSARGQFVTQDPVFWGQKQNIKNPQSLNSYSQECRVLCLIL